MNLTQYNNPDPEPNLFVIILFILSVFISLAWLIDTLF